MNNPYENIEFKTVNSSIKNLDGSNVASASDVVVPAHWADLSSDILVRNYFRKNGVPSATKKVYEDDIYEWAQRSEPTQDAQMGAETDARNLFDRLAGAWVYWGIKGNYFETEEDAKNFFDEMRYMLAMQMAAPNSPQWFNTGVHWAYGITGEAQGHCYFDEIANELKKSTSAYERPQPHACFIQSVSDDLVNEGGIMDLWIREARLFKYGSGTGSNFSSIRGSGEKLSGGGYSSGLMSFLRIGDIAGGSIKSGGTTRRAAKMVILDIDHPDIEAFINWKSGEEEKVLDFIVGSKVIKKFSDEIIANFNNKAIVKAKVEEALANDIPENYIIRLIGMLQNGAQINKEQYELNWDSPAYANIFGQNSNNSVRINDEFLKRVEANEDHYLTNRIDGSVSKVMKARYLWEQVAKAAWSCADPGVQFDTTINEWNTCSVSGRINASNPCSEYMFLDDTACNLASLNLIQFVNEGVFDVESFKHASRLWTIVLEISIYMAQFPSPAIAQRSYEYRTLGLGYGNLGALLMQHGIAYDSDIGRNTAAGITALMHGTAYQTSCEMAQFMGPFVKYQENRETMLRVVHNHAAAVGVVPKYEDLNIEPVKFDKKKCVFKEVANEVPKVWEQLLQQGKKYGFRNAQVTLLAPTGTIGFVMGFRTNGVEPQYSQVAIKQLAGGGVFKIVNKDIANALITLKYSEKEIAAIEKYVVGHGNIVNAPGINNAWLIKHGFSKQDLENVNHALKNAFHISNVFTTAVLGTEFFEARNLAKEIDLLSHLGASADDIEAASLYACGHMTIEGAPYLKDSHIDIFDCAVPGGGIRSLSYASHIKMMAAIQPFLSGAISKTINMSGEATMKDCQDSYMLAWKLGLKAVALYRSGSKYSSVMSTKKAGNILDELLKEQEIKEPPKVVETPDLFVPFRRRGYTQHVMIGDIPLWHTTGEDENGSLRNILLTFGKEGSTLRGWASAWGRILSMYLQEKGDAALLRVYKAFKHSKFEPMGEVQGHSFIKYASSIPDYIVEDLVHAYPEMLKAPFESNSLPATRNGKINKIKIGQETMYIIIGEDIYGKPAEIFVAGMGNEGSDLKGWMSSCAKLISLYFQDCSDTAVWHFINAFEGSSFDPSGFVEGHKSIRSATSPMDFLAKHIRLTYSQVLSNEQTLLPIADNLEHEKKDESEELKIRAMGGYKVDEPCKSCRAFKLRYNGTCYICDNCFTTTGCS